MNRFAIPALVAASLGLSAVAAQAVTLVGLNSQNQLAMIDTANVAGAVNLNITGLATGDRLVGIDTRPSNGLVYGVSVSNNLYTLNTSTGAASFVVALGSAVVQANLAYGIDFNPVADGAGAASLRLISSSGSNFAVNATTGAVGNAASNIGAGFTSVAYSNATPLGPVPASTALYYINSATDTLQMAGSAFNSPSISTIGALGVDALNAGGFELLSDNSAYAALNTDNGSALASGIYSINLGTGQATLLGTYNGTLSGLTAVSAVPEPQALALMLAGLAGIGFMARRQRQR